MANGEACRTPSEGKNVTRYIPLPQAARLLRISLNRAIELIRARELRARLVGGRRWFVDVESLQTARRRARSARPA
jgi:Helix-turn-helix domain